MTDSPRDADQGRMADRAFAANDRRHRDYMVRIDDMVACPRCRKRFEIPMSQSVVFI